MNESDDSAGQGRADDTPLYLQIATLIRGRINDGFWLPNDKLPTIAHLVDEFGVARATVRQALSVLESDGLIVRHRGRGTYVREKPKTPSILMSISVDRDQFESDVEGDQPLLVETERAEGLPGFVESIDRTAETYQYILKSHSVDGSVYALDETYLDEVIYEKSPFNILHHQTLEVILDLDGSLFGTCEKTIGVELPNSRTAGHLDISQSSPCAVLYTILRDTADKAILVSKRSYRGDKFMMRMVVR